MLNVFYLLLVLAVGFISFWRGFRRGFTGSISSVLGFSFGAVASRILTPDLSIYFKGMARFSQDPDFSEFTVNLVCAVVIYIAVFWIFSILGLIFRRIFSIIEMGMFNRLLGAFFSLTIGLLWLSILLNLLLCFSSGSGLLKYEKGNDGNLIASVMAITPALLGCYGAEDFAHFHQLKEAKFISCNFKATDNVIITQG